jgi:hypothetical protein
MRFKPALWFPIAVILAAVNLVYVPFVSGDPWHAFAHGALGVGFALWAQRLKQRRDAERGEQRGAVEAGSGERVDVLEDEMTKLRQELSDAQERLDFTERMLTQHDQTRGKPQP